MNTRPLTATLGATPVGASAATGTYVSSLYVKGNIWGDLSRYGPNEVTHAPVVVPRRPECSAVRGSAG